MKPTDTDMNAAVYMGVSVSLLRKWRFSGCGPKYYKVGRRVIYRRSDCDEFLASRAIHPGVDEREVSQSG